MKRVIDALGGLLIGVLGAGGIVLLAAGPIMNLPGKVDSNNALVVASVAAGSIGSQGSPIANLPGKVDANNALVVTMSGDVGPVDSVTADQVMVGDTALMSVPSDLNGASELTTLAGLYVGHTTDAGTIFMDQANTTSAGAGIVGRRARGTPAAPLDVANNDQLAYIDFRGYSGTKFWQQASVAAHVDSAVVSGQAPSSRLVFSTNLANGIATEQMRINRKGEVLINTTAQISGFTDAKLTVVQDAGTGDYAMGVKGGTTSGSSYGLRVEGGVTTADGPLWLANSAGTIIAKFDGVGNLVFTGRAFASLGAPANGAVVFCTDCAPTSNPCTGSSTGAIATRLNGAWDCR